MGDEITINGRRYTRLTEEMTITVNGELYALVADAPDGYLTVAEIVALTGKSPGTVHRAMREGLLPFTVPNGCKKPRRAKCSDVDAWMAGTRVAGAQASEPTPATERERAHS